MFSDGPSPDLPRTSPTARTNRIDGAPGGRTNVAPLPRIVTMLSGLSIAGRAVPPSKFSTGTLNTYRPPGNRVISSSALLFVLAVLNSAVSSATAPALLVFGSIVATSRVTVGSGSPTCTSTAPMSAAAPAGRGRPRASVGTPVAGPPASMTGLPANGARVGTGPP